MLGPIINTLAAFFVSVSSPTYCTDCLFQGKRNCSG